jgi:glycosyltransferase involved in cell wall biosynthesis
VKYNRDAIVLPNGVKIPQIAETEDVLTQYDLLKGRYVLSVGRLVPERGFHNLIDAFNMLPCNDWKLVIVGRIHHEDRYSVELKEKGSTNRNIIFTAFLTGKPLQELYSHAGLFVLPSSHEGFPMALLEAMSYGLSCIASHIPGIINIGLDEERFFESGNIGQLTSRMATFMNKPFSADERK